MIPQRTLFRFAPAIILAVAASVLPGCGGGSNTTAFGPVAIFTPDTASPAAGTVALLPGTGNGASISVRVTVTGVTGFFGAAFRVTYDTNAMIFTGMTSTASFLRTGVTDNDVIFLEDHTTNPGEIVITATRKDPSAVGPVDVGATADLVVLNFSARKVIVPATAEGRVDFADPKQVCDGTVAVPGCGAITVTWSGGGISAQ